MIDKLAPLLILAAGFWTGGTLLWLLMR